MDMPGSGQPGGGFCVVLDAAALQREAHVRATIVDGEDAPAIVDHKDRTMGAVQNEPTLCLELF
jgi:hypothetical protein